MSTSHRTVTPYRAYVLDRIVDESMAGASGDELVALLEQRAGIHEQLSATDPNPETTELGLDLADRYRARARALRRGGESR